MSSSDGVMQQSYSILYARHCLSTNLSRNLPGREVAQDVKQSSKVGDWRLKLVAAANE